MSDKLNQAIIISGAFIAIGLSLTGYFASQTLYNAKVALNTAEVKGLAEKRVKADRVNWNVSFSIAGLKQSDIPSLYKKSEEMEIISSLNSLKNADNLNEPNIEKLIQKQGKSLKVKCSSKEHTLLKKLVV